MKVSRSTNHPSRRTGFTLTELMMVVSLVGILSAMALPYAGKVRENARLSLIHRNLRDLDAAKDRWALDHRKVTGDVINDISELSDYLHGGKLIDAINESYVLNPVGTPPEAALPAGVALGPYSAGSSIAAP